MKKKKKRKEKKRKEKKRKEKKRKEKKKKKKKHNNNNNNNNNNNKQTNKQTKKLRTFSHLQSHRHIIFYDSEDAEIFHIETLLYWIAKRCKNIVLSFEGKNVGETIKWLASNEITFCLKGGLHITFGHFYYAT